MGTMMSIIDIIAVVTSLLLVGLAALLNVADHKIRAEKSLPIRDILHRL